MKTTRHKTFFLRLQAGIFPSLPTWEFCTYLFIWLYTIFVVIEHVFRVALDYRPFYSPGYFTQGWSFLTREKDVSDYEWTVWSNKYIEFIPWTITHIIITQVLWLKKPQFIPYFYIIFSLLSMVQFVGFFPTVYMVVHTLIMFPTYIFKNRIFCWVVGMALLLVFNISPLSKLLVFLVAEYSVEEYIMSVETAWLNIRCLSFCLHRCSEPRKDKSMKQDLVHYLGYCFYFPLLYTGPLMMFNEFEKQLMTAKPKWNNTMLAIRVANVIRFIFWYLFFETILHYFYVSAFRSHPALATQCSLLALNGIGYTISQLFMVKYTVLYGLPGAIAQLEHFEPPAKPKCVACIHLYSDMWRFFDRGLYGFFKRYIYIPALGENSGPIRKIVASMLCFLFVFVWHGSTYTIFIWVLLNFIEVLLEMLGAIITASESFIKFEENWLSPTWSRRLRAVCSVPLVYLGCISNFYFLVGHEVTNVMLDRLIFNVPWLYFLVQTCTLYCMSQVSIEVRNYELSSRQQSERTTKGK